MVELEALLDLHEPVDEDGAHALAQVGLDAAEVVGHGELALEIKT